MSASAWSSRTLIIPKNALPNDKTLSVQCLPSTRESNLTKTSPTAILNKHFCFRIWPSPIMFQDIVRIQFLSTFPYHNPTNIIITLVLGLQHDQARAMGRAMQSNSVRISSSVPCGIRIIDVFSPSLFLFFSCTFARHTMP